MKNEKNKNIPDLSSQNSLLFSHTLCTLFLYEFQSIFPFFCRKKKGKEKKKKSQKEAQTTNNSG